MNDHVDLAFECILLPSTLDTKVLVKTSNDTESKSRASAVLKELLTQLSNVSKAQMASANDGQVPNGDVGSLKKKAYIQMMVVKIFAFLSWDLSSLNDVPTLQLLLLETLSCIMQGHAFAQILFHRWILRTAPVLNFPTPPANKAQIFNNNGASKKQSFYFIIDPPTGTTINNASGDSLKFLVGQHENIPFDSVPTKDSFRIGSDAEKEFLPVCGTQNWTKVQKSFYQAQILRDLSSYYLYLEDYDNCRKCLAKIKSIDSSILNKAINKAEIEAFEKATARTKKKIANDQVPLYHQIKDELGHKHREQSRPYESALAKNIPQRIDQGLPFPQSEDSVKKADLKDMDLLVQYLNEIKTVNYGKPPAFNEKFDKSKSKGVSKHVKKRDLLLALMREQRPDKIMKLIQDLQKISVNVKKAVLRWKLEDWAIVQAAGRTIDSDFVYVMLAKVQQLIRAKVFDESKILLTATERVINDKPWSNDKAKATHFLQMHKAALAMKEYQNSKGQRLEEEDLNKLVTEVKDCFDNLIKAGIGNVNQTQSELFELTVATLLNLEQFEFISQRSSVYGNINMVRLASLMSSAVCKFHKKYYNTGEFKENCKALAEILLPVLQHQGMKRSSMGSSKAADASEKQWIKRLLRRLHSPQVLSMLSAFFVTYYNSINEDASLEIQCELPPLPLTVNSSISINEDSLLSFIHMLAKNCRHPTLSWSLRIQGEVHFAQGNYLAALQDFVQTLIVSTQFFTKPWTNSIGPPSECPWDERIFVKMIKCTSELGHHAESMVLCQYQSEVDYVTAFKSLEERNGFDAMDGLYPFLWDVTILEYAVSMHNKKGEISRKRKALETISQLEINTNNTEEILSAAQAARRGAFLRYMAANYV